ncbi:hypothetical protein COCON_G00207130, partial [Conger conger]
MKTGSRYQARKPKRPHYVPCPPGKPFKYHCFQCPFTCNEKSHLFNHMKYDLCKDSISLVTRLHRGTTRPEKTPASRPAPRPTKKPPSGSPASTRGGEKGREKEPVFPRDVESPSRPRPESQKKGEEMRSSFIGVPSAFSRVPARTEEMTPTETPGENPFLPVLSPPFYHPTLTWGHPTNFQREDSTKVNYPPSVTPGHPNFVFPAGHHLPIYHRSVLPWDTDTTHSLDPRGSLYPTPSPLQLAELPYGYYHSLLQTPLHHSGLHYTPKQLPHPNQESGHNSHPWLVYPHSHSKGDARSAPTLPAHWGTGGGEW